VQLGKALDLNICDPIQKPIDLEALGKVLADIRSEKSAARLES